MKIAIMACLFAKGNVNVNARHVANVRVLLQSALFLAFVGKALFGFGEIGTHLIKFSTATCQLAGIFTLELIQQMFLKNIANRFLPKGTEKLTGSPNTVQLLVELSFVASAQVAFKDSDGRLRIKRFKDRSWQTTFSQVLHAETPIELRTFIYTPHLKKSEEVVLTIIVDGKVLGSQQFPIPVDADYAGWFQVLFTPE